MLATVAYLVSFRVISMKQISLLGALALTLAIGPLANAQTIKADGSSTVYPITAGIAERYRAVSPRARVTVAISGTGGGFKKFVSGDTDISNASRPIKATEMTAAKARGISFIELPVAMDAITVVVNKNNTWASNITTAELKKIWQPGSNVRLWSQVRAGWPSRPIKLYGPGTDSGTFDYFTEAVNGKEKASRSDYTASEDDNVIVQGVSRDIGALGYFGLAYYEENQSKLKAVSINGVQPTASNVISGKYKPLARPLFIYVSSKAAKNAEVAKFVRFYLSNAAAIAPRVGYVALPSSITRLAMSRFNAKKTGTVFGGSGAQVGVTLAELLRREKR